MQLKCGPVSGKLAFGILLIPVVILFVPTRLAYRARLGMDLRGHRQSGANIQDMNLEMRDLSYSKLPKLEASFARLAGCSFRDADLREADFMAALLNNADFTGADLRNARLKSAPMKECILLDCDLRSADMSGASLVGADLSGALLEGTNLEDAVYDSSTKWPVGFNPRNQSTLNLDAHH